MATIATIIEKAQEQFRLWFWHALAVLVLLLLFSITAGGVSQHEQWNINHVEISGTQVLNPLAIQATTNELLRGDYYFVYARSNSYLYPKREITETLFEKFPRIASTTISRASLNTLNVAVSERDPFALWCGIQSTTTLPYEKHCWFLDQTGFIFDTAPTFSNGVYLEYYGPLASPGTPIANNLIPSYFKKIKDFSEELAPLAEPFRATINDKEQVALTIEQSNQYPALAGAELRFNIAQDPKLLTKNLIAALAVQFPPNGPRAKKNLDYIDLRFDNKVFFGFEN